MRLGLCLLVVACGPSVEVPLDSDSGTTAAGSSTTQSPPTPTSSAAVTSAGPTPTPTTSPPTTDDSGTTTGTAGQRSEDSSSGGYSCGPSEEFEAEAWLDNGGFPGARTFACTISSVFYGDAVTEIRLACDDASHSVTMRTPTDPVLPGKGTEVLLDTYHTDAGYSRDGLLNLRTTSGRLLLASSVSHQVPGDAEIPADFFEPLQTEVIPDLCEIEPGEAGDFVGTCFDFQRETIRFEVGESATEVLDRNRDVLDAGYVIALAVAERRHEINCALTPEHWYAWVVYEAPPQ